MKKLTKVSVTVVAISSALILIGPLTAFAIAAPDLGTASAFSALGVTSTADGSGATISADLGYTTKTGTWTHTGGTDFTTGAQASAVSAATAAWNAMGSSGGTAWNPATVGATLTTGLYTRDGDATFDAGNTLTLSGSATDVWIFQINSSLTVHGTIKLAGEASACNVFWRVASDATINLLDGGTTNFVGTLIAHGNVSLTAGSVPTVVNGRMMALTGTLSTAGVTTISGCASGSSLPSVGSLQDGTITVVKTVINDNGGTKTVADFPLFVNGVANGHQPVISGETNTFHTNGLYPYTVTETSDPNYTATFSGDCDANGFLNLVPGDHKVCLITNNDKGAPVVPPVPPLIDVVKTASPLALPNGPGPVTYTYTLRNIGTVPVTDVTMVGDTCSPIILSSGDTNGDHKLDVSETWVFHCTTTLSATHTNTVVATGWANGISAVDIASATVVVGAPVVPPLIHVVKVPSVFTLPAPGGAVTYTYTVTNPGTVPLSDVSITDNKCTGLPGRVVGHPGDLNKNNLLDPGETWQFTCKSNLTQTTTNIGTAAGSANGLTARDFAIATVVVASPALPSTGLPPRSRTPWDIFITAGILMVVSSSLVLALKKRTV